MQSSGREDDPELPDGEADPNPNWNADGTGTSEVDCGVGAGSTKEKLDDLRNVQHRPPLNFTGSDTRGSSMSPVYRDVSQGPFFAPRTARSSVDSGLSNGDNFRIATNNMTTGIFMMNAQGYVTFMNPAAERLTGWQMEAIRGITFHEAVHSKYPDGSPYPISECPIYGHQVSNISVQNAPETFLTRSGEFVPIMYSVCPLRGGYEEGAVVEFRDVRKEKRAEEEKLKALLEAEKAEALMGSEAALRRKMTEFIDFVCHEVRNPLHGISANVAFLTETLSRLEATMQPAIPATPQAPTLSTFPSSRSSFDTPPVGMSPDPSFKPPRTPVMVIPAGNDLSTLFSQCNTHLESIRECADHQSHIINSVLDLSRLEAGKASSIVETFSPYSAVTTSIQMIKAKASERGGEVSLELDEPSVKDLLVNGDPTTLRQIYLNFGSNASKFVREGKRIFVRLGAETDHKRGKVLLRGSVEDEGIGMAKEEMSHLFQRFSQANRQHSERYSGSGLGLSITKELVKTLSGTIDAKSEKGVGSTFSFTAEYDVPTEEEAADWRQVHGTKPAGRKKGKRIGRPSSSSSSMLGIDPADAFATSNRRFQHCLAADDNAINRTVIRKFLRGITTVAVASDGTQAFGYVTSDAGRDLDLIIMDLEMPKCDGRESARLIREWEARMEVAEISAESTSGDGEGDFLQGRFRRKRRGKRRRIVICALSGNARPEQVAEAMAAGMDDYLTKPCTREALETMIAKWEAIEEAEEEVTTPM